MFEKKEIKLKANIKAKIYDQSSLTFWKKLWNKIVVNFRLNRKRYYILGNLKFIDEKHNIICNSGLAVLAALLASDNANTGNINKMALGTGTGTFNGSETALYTETYRNSVGSYTSDGAIAYVTAYFTETEVTGNFTEFGNFIDGEAGSGTGKLFSHVSISWTKTNVQVLVVDAKYTLANA